MDISFLNRKENLILTAIEVIDELGIQGLSTREVAKRQNMSNAVLFSHFHSKNELIISVLQYFYKYDIAMIQTIEENNIKAKDAIIYIFETLSTYYENYPTITAIIQATDGLLANPELAAEMKNLLVRRDIFLIKLIEEAQESRQICSDVSSEIILDIITGSFKKVCLKWRVENYGFSLKEQVLNTINAVLNKFSSSN